MSTLVESQINIVAISTTLEGKLHFDDVSRVHGKLIGKVTAAHGSTLILAENSQVEGEINGDTVIVGGFVRGDVHAQSKITLAATGRVIGNLQAPRVEVEFGAFFEGRCSTGATQSGKPHQS